MDFKLVIVVLFTYFVRPQDWMPGMSGFNIMKPLMSLALVAMFTRRRGFSPASLIRTPIDWAVVAYALYIIISAPEGQRQVGAVVVFLAYFFVTAQALSTQRRLAVYLRCWLIAILIVAAMAVMSKYGLDLTGAKDITNAIPEKPRLVLNTYLFNNPNSLGHTVVIAVALAYPLLFWRKRFAYKLASIAAILLAAYCVYLTSSKGAYIVGFSLVVASQIIGRSRIFQLIAILLAATIGWTALSQLPRMAQIGAARQDEAILGRMLAWEQARLVSQESATGEGFKNFQPLIIFDDEEISKATHSSYVLVGAELGRNGMFFYLAVLYASLRALLTSRCRSVEDERSRRAMFIILLAYLLSGWLIDRSYHLEFFLLAGAIAAFHRRLGVEAGALEPDTDDIDEEGRDLGGADGAADEDSLEPDEPYELEKPWEEVDDSKPYSGPALAYTRPSAHRPTRHGATIITSIEDVDTSAVAEEAIQEELTRRSYWRRIGIIDVLLVLLFAKIVFELWDYVLKSYFA